MAKSRKSFKIKAPKKKDKTIFLDDVLKQVERRYSMSKGGKDK